MNIKINKLTTTVGRYLLNLGRAVFGIDPFRAELDDLKGKYEKTSENVRTLREYAAMMEGMTESRAADTERLMKELDDCRGRLDIAAKDSAGLQQLVENLRERIEEKDRLISQMKDEHWKSEVDYEKRISDYSAQVARLQGELKGRRPIPKRKAGARLPKNDDKQQ